VFSGAQANLGVDIFEFVGQEAKVLVRRSEKKNLDPQQPDFCLGARKVADDSGKDQVRIDLDEPSNGKRYNRWLSIIGQK
jgi:hypothetical protein